jgi:hypothetical protein
MKTIQLTRGLVSLVDDADYESVSNHSWYAMMPKGARTWYAASRMGGRIVMLHRFLMNPPTKMVVDHIDGNGLHNFRSNLRVCTQSQNGANRPKARKNGGFKGVCKQGSRFVAYIRPNRVKEHLGSFATAEDAAMAYDNRARQVWGEFAKTNFESHSVAVADVASN